MNCERVRELLEQRLDGTLPMRESKWVGAHLADCDDCRRYAAGLEKLAEVLEGLPGTKLDQESGHASLSSAVARIQASRAVLQKRLVAVAAGIVLVVIIGYLTGRGTSPAPSDVRVVATSSGDVCISLAGYAYELNPGMMYRAGDQRLVAFQAGESAIALPASLRSHGPYWLRDEHAGGGGQGMCVPYVSPFGEVLVLHIEFMTSGQLVTDFEVFSDDARIMHHGVTWRHGEKRIMLEGRVPAAYLLDLAMEMNELLVAGAHESSEEQA
ncbi:zf-HC2 domain-containing protein [bacterium]|nr:zf-HC2 domain-containing protein [candidate division CSSED10-310 bacterium]